VEVEVEVISVEVVGQPGPGNEGSLEPPQPDTSTVISPIIVAIELHFFI
jgi:hypothetical protein